MDVTHPARQILTVLILPGEDGPTLADSLTDAVVESLHRRADQAAYPATGRDVRTSGHAHNWMAMVPATTRADLLDQLTAQPGCVLAASLEAPAGVPA